MNESLLSYYGVQADDEPEQKAEEVSSSSSPIAAQQGAAAKRADKAAGKFSLDSDNFDADTYVANLLNRQGIKDLVDTNNRISDQKKRLDSDMQMLVYENYNKFISATDMIRQMKDNVDSMEREMTQLEETVKSISQKSNGIETNLNPNRSKVENLVQVSRLLKRLEFLFELPGRLQKSIQMGAHAQAVKYFRVSNSILQQYKHIKSFDKIRVESEHIIHFLKITLRAVVKDPQANPEAQMENAAMLIDLNSPAEHLLHDIFTTRRAKLKQAIDHAIALSHAPLSPVSHSPPPPSSSSVHSPPVVTKEPSIKKKTMFDDDDGEDEDGGDKEEGGEPADKEKEKEKELREKEKEEEERRVAEEEEKERQRRARDVLVLLHIHFIEAFHLFTSSFLHTFENNKVESKKCVDALNEFAREVFGDYFAVVRKELLNRGTIKPKPVKSPGAAGGVGVGVGVGVGEGHGDPAEGLEEEEEDGGEAVVRHLLDGLGTFQESMNVVVRSLPHCGLGDRASEVIENAVRHAVDSVFDHAFDHIVVELKSLHGRVLTAHPTLSPNPCSPLPSVSPSSSSSPPPPPPPSSLAVAGQAEVKIVCDRIKGLIESAISVLSPLLQPTPPSPNTPGGDLCLSRLLVLLNNFTLLFLCGSPLPSEGPVHQGHARSLLWELQGVNSHTCPVFLLYLAEIAVSLDVKRIFKFVKQVYNATAHRFGLVLEGEEVTISARVRETGDVMLHKYLQLNARRLAAIGRRHWASSPSSVHTQPSGKDEEDAEDGAVVVGGGSPLLWSSALNNDPLLQLTILELLRVRAELTLFYTPSSSSLSTSGGPPSSAPSGFSMVISPPSERGGGGGGSPPGLLSQSSKSKLLALQQDRQKRLARAGNRSALVGSELRVVFDRVPLWGNVRHTPSSVFIQLAKMLFKSSREIILTKVLTMELWQLLQAQMYVLREEVFDMLNEADRKEIESLIDEALHTGFDRCKEAKNGMVEATVLDECYLRWKTLFLETTDAAA